MISMLLEMRNICFLHYIIFKRMKFRLPGHVEHMSCQSHLSQWFDLQVEDVHQMLLGRQGTLPGPRHISKEIKNIITSCLINNLFVRVLTKVLWKMNLGNNSFSLHVDDNCLSVTSNVFFAITRKRDT